MAVPVSDLVRRIRAQFEDRPIEDTVALATTSSATSIVVGDGTRWGIGQVLEWDDDSGEQSLVRAISTNTLTIKRRHAATDAVAHGAATVIVKNPRFGYDQITKAINRTLTNVWPRAWGTRTFRVTPVSTQTLYPLPSDVIDLVTVTQATSLTDVNAYVTYGSKGSGAPVSIRRGLDPNNFGSGKVLSLDPQDLNHDIIVTYRASAEFSDIEEGDWAETIVYGTCAELLASKEAPRAATDISMGDQTVVPGTNLRTALAWYQQQFKASLLMLHSTLLRDSAPMTVYG